MKETCPDAIKSYAQCVMDMENATNNNNNNNNSEQTSSSSSSSVNKRRGGSGSGYGVSHGACQEEFVRVKECFRQVRTSL